jgi:hypothetical protein
LVFAEHGRIVHMRAARVTQHYAGKSQLSDGTGCAKWSLGAFGRNERPMSGVSFPGISE